MLTEGLNVVVNALIERDFKVIEINDNKVEVYADDGFNMEDSLYYTIEFNNTKYDVFVHNIKSQMHFDSLGMFLYYVDI